MPALYPTVAALAALQPDAPALQAGPRRLSRADFLALVDHTAGQFQAEGLGAGSLVGWLGQNSPEMLAALLACAKLGAVWVPLNWRLAVPELVAIATHAGLSALKYTPELAPLAGQVLALAPCANPVPPCANPVPRCANPVSPCAHPVSAGANPVPPSAALDPQAQPGDVMLVYTSGTTGAPKGAMQDRKSVV